jgi:dTMP kinase
MAGLFITFEGGEGTGKSTQAKRLAEHLRRLGRTVILTREPGGTEQGEAVRNLLVNGDPARWSATAEALLNNTARDTHLRDVICPALQRGDAVISDRFMDSTRAYQGHGGHCPMALIDELEKYVVGATRPDVTLVFDLDPAIGLARAKSRGAGIEDRYERKGLAFHEALRKGFLAIAAAEPARCKLINASLSEAEVFAAVLNALCDRLHG